MARKNPWSNPGPWSKNGPGVPGTEMMAAGHFQRQREDDDSCGTVRQGAVRGRVELPQLAPGEEPRGEWALSVASARAAVVALHSFGQRAVGTGGRVAVSVQ